MNIALFSDCYTPIKNGVVTSLVQLKEGLEKNGHTVFVVTVEVPGYREEDPRVLRLPSFRVGLGSEQRFALVNQIPITRLMRENRIDIVHTHTEFAVGYSGKWVSRRLKIPHVHTTHTLWEEYRHYILNGKLINSAMARKVMKTFLRGTHAVIAPSIKAKNYYGNIIPGTPIRIIHNGIDALKFRTGELDPAQTQQLRREFHIRKNDRLLIFVGRIGKEKRVAELFEAVVPVLRERENVKMIFVGDGPRLKHLMKSARALNLEDRFVFTGFVNWQLVYQLYSISDIFVSASLSEVHPMTFIEAVMCSLAVVARRDESILDMVVDDRNGFAVEDDSGLTEKVLFLLGNPRRLNIYKRNSHEISEAFTAENHVAEVEAYYREIIGHYPGRLRLLNG